MSRSRCFRIAGLPMAGVLGACMALATSAGAATINITGVSYATAGISFPGYGSSVNQHNVVTTSNNPSSGITDKTGGQAWKIQGSHSGQSSAVLFGFSGQYDIDWYFNGAESGDVIQFTSGLLTKTENNQNNVCTSGCSHSSPANPGWQMFGTTSGAAVAGAAVPFTLDDTNNSNANGTVVNGSNRTPGQYLASLMFSYAKPIYNSHDELVRWKLTKDPTDWFVFGFDDNGSKNDNHDDFVGIGHVRLICLAGECGGGGGGPEVPLPPAAWLFGTALVGMGALSRRRRRRDPTA